MARRVSRGRRRKITPAGWFGIGCGATLVIGLIALGVVYYLLTAEPPLPPEAAQSRQAQSQPTSGSPASSPAGPGSHSAPSLEQQIRQVQRASRSRQPTQVTLTVQQDDLNSLIRRQAPPDVRDLTFYFGDGTVAGTGEVTWEGRRLHLTVRARPVVSGGQVALDVQEVRLGRLQAPAGIQQQVRDQLNRGVQELLSERTMRAESVEVRPGVMTIQGRVGGR